MAPALPDAHPAQHPAVSYVLSKQTVQHRKSKLSAEARDVSGTRISSIKMVKGNYQTQVICNGENSNQ